MKKKQLNVTICTLTVKAHFRVRRDVFYMAQGWTLDKFRPMHDYQAKPTIKSLKIRDIVPKMLLLLGSGGAVGAPVKDGPYSKTGAI